MRSELTGVMKAVWARGTGRIGFVLVVFIVAFSLLGPFIFPHEPNALNISDRFSGPGGTYWLGTDHLGRDLASRLAYGGRIALLVALGTITIALIAGTLLGILAAMSPPRIERFILIAFDIIASFPTLVFALAVVALFGAGLWKVIVIVGITFVPHFGRVARAQTLTLLNSPFLDAERALGASNIRIIFVHLLPNIMGPLVVLASMDIPIVITIEAGLSFLGVGVPPPAASWGALLYDGYNNVSRSPWPVIFAGAVLTIATLGFTLFGEALRDVTDPKLRSDP